MYTDKKGGALFGQVRRNFGKIYDALVQQTEWQILEGDLQADCNPMYITILLKHSVASLIGFLKGKSAIGVAREFGGNDRNFSGIHLWVRGYAVSAVSFELAQVGQYIPPRTNRMDQRASLKIKGRGHASV